MRQGLWLAVAVSLAFASSDSTSVEAQRRAPRSQVERAQVGRAPLGRGSLAPAESARTSGVQVRSRPWAPLRVARRRHPAAALTPAQTAAELTRAGLASADASKTARHLVLGVPSAATTDNLRDLLLCRRNYALSYNAERNVANWVAWRVTREDLHTGDGKRRSRSKSFRVDEALPTELLRVDSNDYRNSGFTRGHMVASGERQASREDNRETFLMTNMIPHAEHNNSGPWNRLEEYYRRMVAQGYEAHVLAGGAFAPNQPARTIGRGVAVPDSMWKVVALLRPGQGAESIDEHTRVIAVSIPNDNARVDRRASFAGYRVSVADIERDTGLQFFTNLPQRVADTLRARVDAVPINH